MRRKLGSWRRRALLIVAGAALIAGVLIAILTIPGGHANKHHDRPRPTAQAIRPPALTHLELARASSYLGVGAATLRVELARGRSLAQIAAATPSRSAHGLLEALLRPRAQRIERLHEHGKTAAKRMRQRIARIRARLQKVIERSVGSAAAAVR